MSNKGGCKHDEEEVELRRGPWTVEEDALLIHYIACHGEGRWNLLAKSSGLRRTGKSCRLRWLNYLKPDVKRGNLTPEEQILILELHSKWGNRWSRIAQHLPGRTDNEIKNYWRTRVQKQAKQLKIDANSALFRDTIRRLWMPRLLESMGSSQPLESPAADQNLPIPTSPPPVAPFAPYGMFQQSQFPGEMSSTTPCSHVVQQLPDYQSIQFPSFDACGQLLGAQAPIQATGIGSGDLTSDVSMSVWGDGVSPWDDMDELLQVLTATRT